MVIAVVSLTLVADRERGELRASFRLGGPRAWTSDGALGGTAELSEQAAAAASPIDDVRGTAAYRLGTLRVLTARALERCLA